MKDSAVQSLPRDIYIAAVARAASALGNGITVTALLLKLHDSGAGSWTIAGMLAASTLPMVLFAPVIGLIVDRYDSQKLIITSSLWQAAACTLLAFVDHSATVLTLVLAYALGAALTMPVFNALTPRMVSNGQVSKANSLQQGGQGVAVVAGPAIGGLLTGQTGGTRVPLLIAAASLFLVVAAGRLISSRRQAAATEKPPKLRCGGFFVLFCSGKMSMVVSLAVLLVLVCQITGVAEVFLIRDTFQSTAVAYGLVLAGYSFGILAGTALSSRLRTQRQILRWSVIAACSTALNFTAVGIVKSLYLVFALHVIAGVGTGLVTSAAIALLLLRMPDAAIGRALACFAGAIRAAALVSYGAGGLLVGPLSPRNVFLIAGSITLVAILFVAPSMWRAANRPDVAPEAAQEPVREPVPV
jgi:MFS family permease